jgi:L,D-transpeptidase ErfK/SrfK
MSSFVKRALVACLALVVLGVNAFADDLPVSNKIVGDKFQYAIQRRDFFIRIASKYGISAALLAADNGLPLDAHWKVGTPIWIDNRHIVPRQIPEGIIINLPQRMLFYFMDGKLISAYPAAVGRIAPQWRTPTGHFKIIQLREDPTWHVPASIQREMEQNGKDIEDYVEPGPNNPLGAYWIGLSLGSLGIHSTNSPLGIYGFHTHGCIRLRPENAEALFGSVDIGDQGDIIYEPTLIAHLDDGHVFLEVNRDSYKHGGFGIEYVRRVAEANHLSDLIDWPKAQEVTDRAEGIARDVGAGGTGEARR